MAEVKIILPKMGEGVAEATIISYTKDVGDKIQAGDTLVEVATDKVDSEIEATETGIVKQIFFKKDEIAKVGDTLALIETDKAAVAEAQKAAAKTAETGPRQSEAQKAQQSGEGKADYTASGRFYSPLVRSIAKEENISPALLDAIKGTGENGRVTKHDMLAYLKDRGAKPVAAEAQKAEGDEIIPMSRVRRLIAEHMLASVAASPHVTSIIEVDMTALSAFRSKIKADFERKNSEKLTFTPFFIWAVSRALSDFPMVNISVSGDNIIKHAQVNIGMAVSLPSEELIVPVIRQAAGLSLTGIAKAVNDLAGRARTGRLKPDEISGGTFSVTNFGNFSTLIGTPIINQPQVAILGLGAIQKVPAVMELDGQDVIAIRQKMYLSLSYDHRVIDGGLGGKFLKRIADYLEQTDFESAL